MELSLNRGPLCRPSGDREDGTPSFEKPASSMLPKKDLHGTPFGNAEGVGFKIQGRGLGFRVWSLEFRALV